MNIVSDKCSTSKIIECTGDEEKCFVQTTTITESKIGKEILTGCATDSYCNAGSQSWSDGGIYTEMIVKCSNGSIGLHKGFFFPAVALLLMKLLS
ncbi:hypothetical protein FKM82_021554 [Ascaphus truei]